jgi:hypothetical protein
MKNIGSGKTYPEFRKELEDKMKSCVLQEVAIDPEDLFPSEFIKKMERETDVNYEETSNYMIKEVTDIMIAVNKQLAGEGIFFKGRKQHLKFVFETSLKVFQQILDKVDQ